MAHLNLKHLRYFWTVATHGSIARGADILHLAPQTISGQLTELEEQIGAKLFSRSGRNLVLTETGRLVFSYADEMFRIEEELRDAIGGQASGSARALNVGIAMVVPKLIAYRLLVPALRLAAPVRLVCHEAPLVDLLGDLSVHKLDLVLADSPLSPALNIRAYSHLLGESGISFFAAKAGAERYLEGFPQSLHGAPMLMPSAGSALRRALEYWFQRRGVEPRVVAELEDRALMKTFGEAAVGIFTSPTVVEGDVAAKYRVTVIGRTEDVKERFYAISSERRIKHPAVSAITDAARTTLFN
jgi:LysR family transcriptional regulator, transcriptional activator of nhaA